MLRWATRDSNMLKISKIILIFLFCFVFLQVVQAASPIGKKSKVPFAKALPEDISNKNFPDVIESFDYPNANIIDLIKAIGKLTGLNFIVDPTISNKKITIVAPSKITVAEAYKAFLSALAINGYTLIKAGAFWKIQETKKALKDNTEIYSDGYFPNTDQLITRIVKLKHIDAKEFSESIKYLLSQNNQISHHSSSNSIIISDYGSVIERIMKIVYEMDIPGSEENVEIITIQHAAAVHLADILKDILFKQSSGRKASRTFRGSSRSLIRVPITSTQKKGLKSANIKISNIIPDERTNSLVVSANEEGLLRVRELVKKLDTYVDPARTGGIYVYNVLYGTAEQIYNTLMGITGNTTSSNRKTRSARSNPPNFGRTRFNNFGRSTTLSSSSPLFENVTILADQNTNSLIISAKNKYDFERVKAVLRKIDVPKDQVFVQAIIVEMSVDKGEHWEINLAQTFQGLSRFLNINGTPVAGFLNKALSASPSTLHNTQFGPGLVLGLPFKDFLTQAGLSGGSTSQAEINKLISDANLSEDRRTDILKEFARSSANSTVNQALNYSMFPLLQILKSAGNINILSTPQITALDNVTASIEVGENAPVGITSTSTTGAGFQNSVQREDVTLRLEITPRINPDSQTIQLDISQKFDDFSTKRSTASELNAKAVHLIKRNIETKMVLNNGETAVLGGLLVDKEVQNENKVPILGDIPILGRLFKGSTISKEKKNLLVFITPTIIHGKSQKKDTKKLLGKKLEDRIHFVKKHMAGRDPHGEFLKKLQASENKLEDLTEEGNASVGMTENEFETDELEEEEEEEEEGFEEEDFEEEMELSESGSITEEEHPEDESFDSIHFEENFSVEEDEEMFENGDYGE